MNAFRGGARLSADARRELGFKGGGKPAVPVSAQRRSMLAKVHLAKKTLNLVEDDYRQILLDETGHHSAGDCTDAELVKVLERFKRQGFTAQKRAGSKPADHLGAGKARALWISLGQLGAINDASDAALEAFARRQLKCAKLQWANRAHLEPLIRAEKAIAERHGWSQSMEGVAPHMAVMVLKRRLIDAQMVKLHAADWLDDAREWDAPRAVYQLAGVEVPSILRCELSQLDQVAQVLGTAIGAARAAGKIK